MEKNGEKCHFLNTDIFYYLINHNPAMHTLNSILPEPGFP